MATLDELQQQLASLSARVDALTTPPDDYYTSKYSGEEIDAGIAKTGSLPESWPLPIASGGTGADMAQLALFNLGGSPSKDLFDNSDFRNPVNQRGVKDTVVQSGGFILDRWTVVYDSGAAPKYDSAGFLSLDNTSGTGNLFLTQKIPQADFGGETGCTISLFCKSGFYFSPIAVGGERVYLNNSKINAILTVSDGVVSATIGIATGKKEEIVAAKLNIGNIQTQAYQKDGQWHLFEAKKYADVLARCLRYYYDSGAFSDGEGEAIKSEVWGMGSSDTHYTEGQRFPVVMRTSPAISFYSAGKRTPGIVSYGSSGHDALAIPVAMFVGRTGFSQINLTGEDPALTGNQAYYFYIANAEL